MTNSQQTFLFNGIVVPFEAGEVIAAALDRAGVVSLGDGQDGCASRYFCGIGAWQACVVSVDGTRMEACLTPAHEGQRVQSIGSAER